MAAGLARGLRDRGHNVVVFCRPGSPLHRELQKELPCEAILWGADFPPPAIGRCARALRRHRTEVVISATEKDMRLSVPAARLLGIPVVVRRVAVLPFRKRLHPRHLLDRMVDHFVANSHATRREMLRSAPWLPESGVTVIHNGIEVDRYLHAVPVDLGLPPGAVAFGFVGRLDPEKGVAELGSAWPVIAGAVPGAHLVITGTGGDQSILRRKLADDPRVHWLGFRRDVPAILKALDVLLIPSRSEAFGLVAAEAMAAGTPVVATQVGGIPEVVIQDEQGILVPPRDPGALARAGIALATDPERRKRMGHSGTERAARFFSRDRVMSEYEAVLDRLVGRARADTAEEF